MTSSGLEVKYMDGRDPLTIGEVSARSGLAPSALRYYESLELITSTRTSGDRRLYKRAVLRRVAVIRAAQQVGLSLDQVRLAFAGFPLDVAPSKRDWTRMSAAWQPLLDKRIADLQQVRDNLNSCVGCGCLSMTQCRLYNPRDTLAETGSGSRRLFPEPQKTDRAELPEGRDTRRR
jgi:MerR family transcriptional regulator, redox-sensitive transcriptional activator SoxR